MKLRAILVENKQLAKENKMKKIVIYIVKQVENIDVQKMRLNPEFIKFICEIIENQVTPKKKEKHVIDKLQIFEDVFKAIGSNEEQIMEGKQIVEFLLTNKMIQRTPYSIMIYYCIRSYFLRLVLPK